MGLIINTNMMSLNLLNDMNKNIKKTQKSSEKLASGVKINRAGDDASGLAVSEKMRNKIVALDTQVDTDEEAINMIQTADGYMAEMQSMVERMVELTMKSTNGVLADHPDRDNLQKEMDQLCGEMDRISSTANFNGIKLLAGSGMQKVPETTVTTVPTDVPYSNLLKDANNFNGTLIDEMDEPQTVEFLADVARNYVRSNGGNNECLNDKAVYYASSGTPSVVAAKDANVGQLLSQLGMDPSDTLNKVETSTFGNVDYYNVMVPYSGYVDNDDIGGSQTLSLVGTAVDSYISGYEDLNCLKGKNVYYSNDGQYAFVAPNNLDGIDIKANFLNMGASMPVSYKSVPVRLTYEYPPSYTIPPGTPVTKMVDKKINLDLKIGESSTNPDKLEFELHDLHTDHLFEPVYSNVQTGTKTVVKTVTSSGSSPYASIGGTKSTQNQYSYSGSSGGSHQVITTVPVYERVNTGAETKANDASTYKNGVSPDISTQDNALKNLDAIKKVSDKISTIRGENGAKQNRIEHTINVITTESENTKAAKSRIQDTDMAVQISQYTTQNIMTQAAQSLFAQANAKPQEVTSLLQG